MALRNAILMMNTVTHTIKGSQQNSQLQHSNQKNNGHLIHKDPGCVDLGKRQAETNAGRDSRIRKIESIPNPQEYNTPLAANDEKQVKLEVERAWPRSSNLEPATTIFSLSKRNERKEMYALHLSACGHARLNPRLFSEWLFAKTEEYNVAQNIRANVQAQSAEDAAGVNFLSWLKSTSRTSPGPAPRSVAAAAHAAPASAEPMQPPDNNRVGAAAAAAGREGQRPFEPAAIPLQYRTALTTVGIILT